MRMSTIKFETENEAGTKSGVITVDRFGETKSKSYFEMKVDFKDDVYEYRFKDFEDIRKMIFAWVY